MTELSDLVLPASCFLNAVFIVSALFSLLFSAHGHGGAAAGKMTASQRWHSTKLVRHFEARISLLNLSRADMLGRYPLPRLSVAAVAVANCPRQCLGHACVEGACVCPLGLGGVDCSFSFRSIRVFADRKEHPWEGVPPDNTSVLDGWSPGPQVYKEIMDLVPNIRLAVEIGVWRGLSASYIAGVLKARNSGVLLAVDTWYGKEV